MRTALHETRTNENHLHHDEERCRRRTVLRRKNKAFPCAKPCKEQTWRWMGVRKGRSKIWWIGSRKLTRKSGRCRSRSMNSKAACSMNGNERIARVDRSLVYVVNQGNEKLFYLRKGSSRIPLFIRSIAQNTRCTDLCTHKTGLTRDQLPFNHCALLPAT